MRAACLPRLPGWKLQRAPLRSLGADKQGRARALGQKPGLGEPPGQLSQRCLLWPRRRLRPGSRLRSRAEHFEGAAGRVPCIIEAAYSARSGKGQSYAGAVLHAHDRADAARVGPAAGCRWLSADLWVGGISRRHPVYPGIPLV